MERLRSGITAAASAGVAAATAAAATAAPPALAGSSSGALADDLIKGQVCVQRCRRGPELLLALLQLLQLPAQQRVLQLHRRARAHLVPLPLLLPQHHLEGSGHGDLGVGPDLDPSLTAPLVFLSGGLVLKAELLLVGRLSWAQQDVTGRKQRRTQC